MNVELCQQRYCTDISNNYLADGGWTYGPPYTQHVHSNKVGLLPPSPSWPASNVLLIHSLFLSIF